MFCFGPSVRQFFGHYELCPLLPPYISLVKLEFYLFVSEMQLATIYCVVIYVNIVHETL